MEVGAQMGKKISMGAAGMRDTGDGSNPKDHELNKGQGSKILRCMETLSNLGMHFHPLNYISANQTVFQWTLETEVIYHNIKTRS